MGIERSFHDLLLMALNPAGLAIIGLLVFAGGALWYRRRKRRS